MLKRGRVGIEVGKAEAIADLAAQAGMCGVRHHDQDAAETTIAALTHALGGDANPAIGFLDSVQVPEASETLVAAECVREIGQPVCTNGRPPDMPDNVGCEHSPALRLLTVPGGLFAHVARAPITLLADGVTVVRDYSSRFAGLIGFYDMDMAAIVSAARIVSGNVLVLSDDIWPLNFCHWLVDTLPRLASVGARRDMRVVVSDARAAFKRDSLQMCGFGPEQIVYLPDFSALRAETLLVPSGTRLIAHPAHKAAPWAMDFLRARIGLPGVLAAPKAARPRKLYVSRAESAGRRVLNEAAMVRLLAPLGYHPATLSNVSLAEQVCLFSQATHVVGLHGAGLANIAFCPAGARLIEIFPATFGTPAYYILAAGQGMEYASYIASDVRPGSRSQLDDVVIDVADFERCCGALL